MNGSHDRVEGVKGTASVDQIVADTLGIHVSRISDEVHYQSIPEWNSIGHTLLMAAIEREYDLKISDAEMLHLRTIALLRNFLRDRSTSARATPASREPASKQTIHRGLNRVVLDQTSVSRIDGERGVLEYRGYSIDDLVLSSTFEDVCSLLIMNQTPIGAEPLDLIKESRRLYPLPREAVWIARRMRDAHPINVLLSTIPVLGAADPENSVYSRSAILAGGIRLIAQVPLILAIHQATKSGAAPTLGGSISDNSTFHGFLLASLLGRTPGLLASDIMRQCLVLQADHGSSAATLSLRVAISTQCDIYTAIMAAIATFAGPLHGGACERVLAMVDEIGSAEDVDRFVSEKLAQRRPIMGFGHRIYRIEDPRVRHLRRAARELSNSVGDSSELAIIDALVDAMRPLARYGTQANVDLYSGVIYRKMGLPDSLSAAIFVVARLAGWIAHALEQHDNNVLIRPLLHYVGPTNRKMPR